jgi:ABC-type ATPase with predicted acetyltransferase domain
MSAEYPLRLRESVTERFHDYFGTETKARRSDALCARFSLLDEMYIQKGDASDWELLHDLHYKAEKLPIGPHFWKLTLHDQTIGVIVTGVPKGMVRERHLVFPNIRPRGRDTRLVNTNRYHYINRNFRVISRFVIDTQFRGIGAGYRMMNLTSRMSGQRFMEIQSSMSKFNAFGQKAGFHFVRPMNANNYDRVLKFLRSHFDAPPADYEAIMDEIARKTPEQQAEVDAVLREWYFRNSALENTTRGGVQAERRAETMTLRSLVRGIQQIGLASPLYGVRKNPDFGREDIPAILPLTAFDRQGANERLIL